MNTNGQESTLAVLTEDDGTETIIDMTVFRSRVLDAVAAMHRARTADVGPLGMPAEILRDMRRATHSDAYLRLFADEVMVTTAGHLLHAETPPLMQIAAENMAGFALAYRVLRPLEDDDQAGGADGDPTA